MKLKGNGAFKFRAAYNIWVEKKTFGRHGYLHNFWLNIGFPQSREYTSPPDTHENSAKVCSRVSFSVFYTTPFFQNAILKASQFSHSINKPNTRFPLRWIISRCDKMLQWRALITKSRACLIKKLFKALYRLENNRWEKRSKTNLSNWNTKR